MAFGSKGYMLNPETATMMLMVVKARVKAIAVWSRFQNHWNKTCEPLVKPFACKYFTKARLPISLSYAQPC
jgi:hypothetical protein